MTCFFLALYITKILKHEAKPQVNRSKIFTAIKIAGWLMRNFKDSLNGDFTIIDI